MPDRKTIELDEFGAEVWELCDGTHSVEQLVKHTCGKYKLNRRQGEVSVVAFMRMLTQRRLIGFAPKKGKGNDKWQSPPATAAPGRPARTRRH